MSCHECLRPCPEHNVTYCSTCHNHPGECSYGGCFKPILSIFNFGFEKRGFCKKHSTSPRYGWLRKGGVLEPTG